MSSSSFENKVLHSILFPNDPLYHSSPCVFGYTCFVHTASPGLNKFSIFGIFSPSKRYKYYSPSTKRYHMFVDITDFEVTPFSYPP